MLKYTSPENTEGALIGDQEYTRLRSQLQQEKLRLEKTLEREGDKIDEWVELSERTFNFARYARAWFVKGDLDTQRAILACVSSNLILKDKKLFMELKKPFRIIEEVLGKAKDELERLEHAKTPRNEAELGNSVADFPNLSGTCNDVRTSWQTATERYVIPNLPLGEEQECLDRAA